MANLNLKFYYSGGQLKAEWTTALEDYGYELAVFDSSNTVVFSKQILLADYIAPVIIQSEQFQPKAGAAYSAKIWVITAPSPPQQVEIINLAKTENVRVTGTSGGVQVNWDPQTSSTGYDVQVFKDKAVVFTKENQTLAPLTISSTDGLEEDIDYTVQVCARAGNAFGAWSDAVPLKLFSAAAILQALQERLLANQPDQNSLILNEVTLPLAASGNPNGVLQLLQAKLHIQSLSLQITTPVALNETRTQLSFAGTADFLGTVQSTYGFVFSVSEARDLSLFVQINPGAKWSFAKNFPSAKLGEFEFWQINAPKFFLVSHDVLNTAVFFPLKPGLNFLAELQINNELKPVRGESDPATLQTMPFGGPIIQSERGVEFHFRGKNAFNDLILKPLGRAPLTLKDGNLKLDSLPSLKETEGNTNNFCIEGEVTLSFATLTCQISIPGKFKQPLSANFQPGSTSFTSVSTFLDAETPPAFKTAMPSTLLALAQVALNTFSIQFTPDGSETTIISSQIGMPDWELSIFSLKAPKLNLVTSLNPNGTQFMRADQLNIAATLGIGTAAFDVNLVAGFQTDWVLNVQNKQPGLQNLATLIGGTENMFTAGFPAQLQSLGTFVPTEVQLAFDPYPSTPVFKYLRFKIEQFAKWSIVSNLLEIDQWHIDMQFNKMANTWQAECLLEGDILLASHPVHLDLSIPPNEEGWTFQFAQAPLTIPGFGDLLSLLGIENAKDVLPEGISKLGNLTITQLDINVDFSDSSPQIKSIAFQINTPSAWTLIPTETLVINRIEVGMTISRMSDGFAAIGFIRGVVTVAGVPVFIQAQRMNAVDPWILKLATTKVIHIPGLAEIAGWMFPDQMVTYIPSAFMPFPDGLDLSDFNLSLDLSNNKLTKVEFVIWNSKRWEIIPNYLAIDHAMINASIVNPLDAPGLTATIQGEIYLGNLGILLAATKADPQSPWHFRGAVEPDTELNFETFFTQVAPNIAIPYEYGFPRSITLKTASAEIVPAQSTFHFEIDTLLDWQFNFGLANLKIQALNALLDVQAPDAEGVRPYSFSAGGQFTIAGLVTKLNFITSNGQSDTIFQALITPEQLTNFQPGALTDVLTTSDKEGVKYGSLPIPQGTGIAFSEAQIFINLSKKIFLVSGSAQHLGKAALLTFQLADEKWAYFIGATLADDFTFGSIHDSLSTLDGVLHVTKAGFSIVSHDLDSLQGLVGGQADLKNVVPIETDGKPIPLKAGVNFYGKLEFKGAIFQNTSQLLSGVAQKPYIALYAFISQVPEDRVFKAWLGQFSLFNFLVFDNIELAYYPNRLNELKLNGKITAVLSSTQQYQFNGAMTVNDKEAKFTGSLLLQQPQDGTTPTQGDNETITAPLGMTGIILESLNFDVDHSFSDTTPSTVVQLSGTVGFGAKKPDNTYPIALTGSIYWIDTSPVLVEIALAKPLDLLMFFQTVFLSVPDTANQQTYLANQSSLTLLQGRIYYYKSPDGTNLTYNNQTYKPNFNLEAKIDLFGKNVNLAIQVLNAQPVNGLSGAQSGVIATGSFDTPITLWFMGFYDSTFSTSPALQLEVLSSRKAFGLNVGLKLFDEQFATGTVTVGKTEGVKDAQIQAAFTYVGSIELLKYSKLAFTYSKLAGFNLSSLPFHSNIPLDLSKLRQAITVLQGGCAEIIDKGFDQLIKTNFLIKPSMKDQGDQQLHVTLKGIYSLSLIDNNHPFLFVDMPEITLTISMDKHLTLSKLPVYLIEQVIANSGSIIQQLISQPVKLSALLSVVGAQALAKGIISHLLCNMETVGETAEAAAEATEAAEAAGEAAQALVAAQRAGATTSEIAELGTAAAEAAEGAMAAAAAAGAGVGAAEGVVVALASTAGAGIGGVIGGFIGSLFGGGGSNTGGSSTHGGGNGGGSHPGGGGSQPGGGGGENPPPLPPKLSSVSAIQFPPVDANTLRVSWAKPDPQAYFQVTLKGGTVNKVQATGGTQLDFGVSDIPYGQYHVEIIAYATAYQASDVAVSGSFWKVAPPVLSPLELAGQIITAKIGQTQTGADAYQALLIMNNLPVGTPQTMKGTPTQVQFNITDLTASYTVQVRSMVNQGIPSPWVAAINSISPLEQPGIGSPILHNGGMSINIQTTVPGANSYQIRLNIDDIPQAPIEVSAAIAGNSYLATFPITDATPGTEFKVQARALGPNALPSLWATGAESVTRLSQPEVRSLAYDRQNGLLKVNFFAAPPGVTHLEIQLVVDGNPYGGINSLSINPEEQQPIYPFSLNPQIKGALFQVQASARGANHLDSHWKMSTQTLTKLGAPPPFLPLQFSQDSLIAQIAEVPEAQDYQFQLLENGAIVREVAIGPSLNEFNLLKVSFPLPEVSNQTSAIKYEVQGRAFADGHLPSSYVLSMPIYRLPAPNLLPLSTKGTTITAILASPVEQADSYQAQLIIDNTPVDQAIPMTIKNGASTVIQAQFTVNNPVPGSSYRVRAQAFGANLIPSTWITSTDDIHDWPKPEPLKVLASFEQGGQIAGSDRITADRSWAMVFNLANPSTVIEGSVNAHKLEGDGNLIIEIHADNGSGLPSGTALCSTIVPETSFSGGSTFFRFNKPQDLVVGKYHLVLRATDSAIFENMVYMVNTGGHLALKQLPGAWEYLGKPYIMPFSISGQTKS